jgi:uncharacterized protein
MNSWQELNELSDELQLSVAASYLHGSLVGLIAGGNEAKDATWLDVALQDETLSTAISADLAEALGAFREATERNLADDEFRFAMLLPEDDAPITDRAIALSDWCGGFLGGLGLASETTGKAGKPKRGGKRIQIGGGQLSADASEAIRDLERIAKADIELDDDDEANEAAIAELIEYIKVGTALIYQELAGFRSPAVSTQRDRTH